MNSVTSNVHELRVSLRDKMKRVEDMEREIDELKKELNAKTTQIKENELFIKKKDEIISMKDSIIKEKDNYIRKLESEIIAYKSKENSANKMSNGVLADTTNFVNYGGDIMNGFLMQNTNAASPSQNNKTKRIAISAEPAQNRFNKTKDMRTNLKKFHKSDEYDIFHLSLEFIFPNFSLIHNLNLLISLELKFL